MREHEKRNKNTVTKAVNMLIRALDSLLNLVVLVICLLLLLASAYTLLDNLWLYQGASDTSLLRYKPAPDAPIAEENMISADHVAWLTVEGTDIDYPIMQGEDNYEYLNKDPYGEFSLSGSIFLDYRNDIGFTDTYSILYGHHMAYGVMFGALDQYTDPDYFDTHRTGYIVTGETVYRLELFAVCSSSGYDETLFNPQDRKAEEILRLLRDRASYYEEPEPGCRIVALSTCAGETLMDRLLVFGVLSET